MANDFFDKYKAKGSDDIETIAQQAPAAPAAQETPKASAQPSSASSGKESGMRFEQKANNGFSAPARSAAPAASRAATKSGAKKTVFGVPVMYLGIGAVVILFIILFALFFGRGKALPAMEGWSTSEAELWANENKINMRVEKQYSDEVAAGEVLSQKPAKGERVGKGEFLTLTVSDGPDLSVMVLVPDIMSMTMAEVEAWADENFMSTVRITTQASDTVPSGKVISFKVNDNTVLQDEIRRDTPFYVTFSKGKSAGEAIKVPNFLTMSVLEAEAFALEKGVVLVKKEEFSDTIAKGNVIRQDIKAEETVYEGDTITIVVSKGEEIIVPNFYSLSQELGAAKASQLGIQTLVSEEYSSVKKGGLISQSIKAGTLYQENDIVQLVYSLGNSYLYTSFLGQNEADAFAWRDEMNEKGASIQVMVQYTANSADYGTIIDQSHINVNIAMDEIIYLVASAGQPVLVPSFVQSAGSPYSEIITKSDVVATCGELGIVPYFIEEYASGRKYNEVWGQNIAAGTPINKGDTIVIHVVPACIGTTAVVPNFENLTVAQAEEKYKDKFALTYQDESGTPISPSSIGSYYVIAQSEKRDSNVADGFAIVLTVAQDPVPTATPTASPDTTPTASPDTTPTASPDTTPTASPDTTPTASPDATPTATQTTP